MPQNPSSSSHPTGLSKTMVPVLEPASVAINSCNKLKHYTKDIDPSWPDMTAFWLRICLCSRWSIFLVAYQVL
jgi:hypothetical protein